MSSNILVLVDALLGLLLVPLSVLIRIIRRIISRIYPARAAVGVLVIKFLGAGNLLAVKGALSGLDFDVVTAQSNRNAITAFGLGRRNLIIDDSSFIKLALSSLSCCTQLLSRRYEQVINLESESKFAKFLTALVSARVVSGVTNAHKSYTDLVLYDRYLVTPVLAGRGDMVSQLLRFEARTNEFVSHAIGKCVENFWATNSLTDVQTICLAPSCSSTDTLRRLPDKHWEDLIHTLMLTGRVKELVVVFATSLDPQRGKFERISHQYPGRVNVRITDYKAFVHCVSTADLLITVDSQALHLRQSINRPAICFYGPTSPLGVGLSTSTLPVTSSLQCSPCTHKYLRLPCGGEAPCMNLGEQGIRLVSGINCA